MDSRKAIVKSAQLFNDSFAVAVLDRPGHQIIGYVLTCPSDYLFDAKLTFYDTIEGYNAQNARLGMNLRSVVTAHILDKNGNTSNETVQAIMYHRKGIDESKPIPRGDWLLRNDLSVIDETRSLNRSGSSVNSHGLLKKFSSFFSIKNTTNDEDNIRVK